MGISDGQPVDASNSNAAWIDKNADDITTGILGLENVAAPSGAFITNIQRVANRLMTATGVDEASADGTTYGAPALTIDDGDNHETALTKLADKFNSSGAGHKHDGTAGQGAVIAAADLGSAPKKASLFQAVDLSTVSGTSVDVSAQFAAKSPSASPLTNGVVVNFPENKVLIRQANGADEDDRFVDGNGDVVFGRLTESVGTWTLSFFVMQSAVEVAHNFTAEDLRWYYQEIFDMLSGNAPVYSEFANIPSDNVTADIISATEALEGKVRRATNVETTTAVVQSQDTRLPTQDENDALVGSNGAPATGNPYVTDSDARNTNQRDALSIQTKAVITPLAPTDGQILAFNTANNQYESVTPSSATSPNESSLIENFGLAASVGASALTLDITQADGSTDPTAPSPQRTAFRDPTSANGGYNIRSLSAALALVISSGSTLGTRSGEGHFIYFYELDNAGTIEPAVSLKLFNDNSIQTSVAEGGAGAADDAETLYSTTARANVPVRLVARLKSNQVTAGTWLVVPTEIGLYPQVDILEDNEITLVTGNQYGSTATRITRFSTVEKDTSGDTMTLDQSAVDGDSITINRAGLYATQATAAYITANRDYAITVNSSDLTINPPLISSTEVVVIEQTDGTSANAGNSISRTRIFAVGDIIRLQSDGQTHTAGALINRLTVSFVRGL